MPQLARSSVLQFGAQAIQTVLGFVATLYFANVLGASLLGQYFLTLALVNWFLLPLAGIQKAINKRVSEGEEVDEFYTAGVVIHGVLVTTITVVLVLLGQRIESYTGYDALWFVIGLFAFKMILTLYLGLFRAEERYNTAAGLEGLWHSSRPIAQAGLLVIGGFGFVSLLWGEVVSMIFGLPLALVGVHLNLSRPRLEHFRRIYNFAKFSWLSNLKSRSYSWMDVVVLGFFVTPSTIGVYEVAWRVTAGFILLPTAMSKIVFPHMSARATEDDLPGVATTLERSLYFAGAFSLPGLIGAYVIGGDVLRLYGPEFTSGAVILVVLSLARIAQSYEVLLLQTLDALDLPHITFRIAFVFVVSNLMMNIVLAWTIGPVGAAIATAASVALSGVLAYRVVAEQITLDLRIRPFVAQVFAALLMGGVVYAIDPVVPDGITGTLISVFAGIGVFGVALLGASAIIRDAVRSLFNPTA